ncbi:MAG: rhodanese-like domain-containing protein [Bacilli bacterium]|nr:rhodanese-like domain-containing protein [Bacilli bacterium]
MREICIKELMKLNNPLIIDIRSHNSYLEEHIPSAINIPYLELIIEYPRKFDRNSTYYIYCDEGHKGRELANYLSQKGYNIVNVIGGFESYKNYKYL